jgi:SSS family solute:Na+ symporter
VTAAVAAVVVLSASVVALVAAHGGARRSPAGRDLAGWALSDRRHGHLMTWCVLGGTIYTAYTFLAVPGLVFGSGGIGFYALTYTVVVYVFAFLVLPRLAGIARTHGYVTGADFIRGRYGSPGLALAVAITGILATMPYIALQLVGIRAVLSVLGVQSDGVVGDLVLTVVFAVLAVSTYRHGLRAPSAVAIGKAVLVTASAVSIAALVWTRVGVPGELFAAAEQTITERDSRLSVVLDQALGPAYVSLALGSALALFAFPHVQMVAFAARTDDVVRRSTVTLLGWTGLLGLYAMFGVAALASNLVPPPGRADLAVPMLVHELAPAWLAGAVLGALVLAALVPAAVMSIGASALFARNVYVEYVHPTATAEQETTVARVVSLLVKLGALGFAMGLHNQNAVNLHLLGAVWVLQTLPPLVLGLAPRAPHRFALLAGWLVGMLAGTAMVAHGGFSPTVLVSLGPVHTQLYAGLLGLAVNLAVVGVAELLLRRWGPGRGLDRTVDRRNTRTLPVTAARSVPS